ncbi:hypothetical protein [Pseudomonas sp. NBRC 111128]|uniref:hypothetical protein n=1 Tax=Pseudomonas sp. NBRC 111128 TaxID=1661043 RepID=UPI0006D3C217|nr:hypothetical protein [Pseudomonas sp. NBRC 111128]
MIRNNFNKKVWTGSVKKNAIAYGAISVASLFVFLIVIGMVLWAVCKHFLLGEDIPFIQIYNSGTAEYWGQIGDFIGGTLNPVLSFAAFMMLLINYLKQKRDSEGNEINNIRTLNNHRFFEFLKLMHEAARGVEVDDPEEGETLRNHRGLGRAWNIFKRMEPKKSDNTEPPIFLELNGRYRVWRSKYWPAIGSYFELSLFVIDQYVATKKDINDFSEAPDKLYFLAALRAQLTIDERSILLYEMMNSKRWHTYLTDLHANGFWYDAEYILADRVTALINIAVEFHAEQSS